MKKFYNEKIKVQVVEKGQNYNKELSKLQEDEHIIIENEPKIIFMPSQYKELNDIDHQIIKEKNQHIEELRSDLSALSDIFADFGEFLGVQGEHLKEINETLDTVEINVEQGKENLQESEGIVIKKRRWVADAVIVLSGIGLGSIALLGGPIIGAVGIIVGGSVGGGVVVAKRKIQNKIDI